MLKFWTFYLANGKKIFRAVEENVRLLDIQNQLGLRPHQVAMTVPGLDFEWIRSGMSWVVNNFSPKMIDVLTITVNETTLAPEDFEGKFTLFDRCGVRMNRIGDKCFVATDRLPQVWRQKFKEATELTKN